MGEFRRTAQGECQLERLVKSHPFHTGGAGRTTPPSWPNVAGKTEDFMAAKKNEIWP